MVRTCEVGLPLPLRTTFTYRIPDALDEATVTGARVLVPFRNRAMLGIVLGRGESQDGAGLKEINEIVDPMPALSPQLVELGRWISSYYLSPLVKPFERCFRPSVEVRFKRQWQISEAGQARLQQLRELSSPSEAESGRLCGLAALRNQRRSCLRPAYSKTPGQLGGRRPPFAKNRTHSPGSKPASRRADAKDDRVEASGRPCCSPGPRSRGFSALWRKTPDRRPWHTYCRKRVYRAG